MMSDISVALVGCGAVAEVFYAPVFIELEKEGLLTIRGLIDPSPERLSKIKSFFPHAICTRDLTKLSDIKLTIIASPPPFHAAQTLQALKMGQDVLCEKPMAVDSSECAAMIAAARSARRILAVGLFRRFFPVVRYIRDLVASKQLGEIRSFAIQEGGLYDWPAKSDTFFRKEAAGCGGGTLLDGGVHVVDLVLHWFGDPEKIDYADDAMGNIETNCELKLSYAGNLRGTVLLSRDWQTTNSYRFEFERGTVSYEGAHSDKIALQVKGSPMQIEGMLYENRFPGQPIQPSLTYPQAFSEQLRDVLDAVRTRRDPQITGEEGMRSLQLIEYCYAHRRLRPMPWLTALEWKAACILAGQVTS